MAGRLGLDPLFQQPEDDEDFETFFQKTLESQKNEYVSPQERKDYFDKIGLGQLDGDTDLKLELYEAPRSRIEQVLKERQANNNQNLAKPPEPSLFSSPIIDLDLAKRGFQSTAIGKMFVGEDAQPAPAPQDDPLALTPLGPSPSPAQPGAYTRTTPGAPPDLSKELNDMRQVFQETAKPPTPQVKTKMIGTPPEEKVQEPSFLDKAMSYLPFGGEEPVTPEVPAAQPDQGMSAFEYASPLAAFTTTIMDDTKRNEFIDTLKQAGSSVMQGLAQVPSGLFKSIGIAAKAIDDQLPTWLQQHGEQKTEEMATYQIGQSIQEAAQQAFPTDPDRQHEFVATVLPQAIGSMLGFMATGGAAGVLGGSRMATTILAGAGAQAPGGYEEAKAAGPQPDTETPYSVADVLSPLGAAAKHLGESSADPERNARKSFLLGLGIGATEAIPIERAIARIDAASGGGLSKVLKAHGAAGAEEWVQEFFQTSAGNAVAQQLYDQDRNILEGTFENAAAGGVAGFMMSVVQGMLRLKGAGSGYEPMNQPIVTNEGVPSPDPTTPALPSGTVASEGTSSPIAPESLTVPDVVELSSASDAIGEGLPPVDLPVTENNLGAFEGQQTTPEVQGPPQAEALQEEGPITEEQILSALGASFPQEAQPKLIKQPRAEEVINEVPVPEPQTVEPSKPLGKRAQAQADLEAKTQLAGLYDTFRYADAMDDQETMQQVAEQLQAQGKDLPDPEAFEQWADIRDTLNAAKNSLGVAGKERGFKALTEVEGQGGTQEVQASKSPTDAWFKELTTNPAPSKYLAEGQKAWNKEKIDRTIEEGLRLLPGEAPSANLQVLLDAIQSDPKYSQLLVAEPDAEYAHRGLFDEEIQGDIFHQEELTPDEPVKVEAAPKAEVVQEKKPEGQELDEILREKNDLSKERLEAYDPEKAVRKIGNYWTYETYQGNSGQHKFDTKREATEGATRHKNLKQDQFDNPSSYFDLTRIQAGERLALIKQYEDQGMSEMEAGAKARAEVEKQYAARTKAPPTLPQKETNKPTPSMFEQEPDDFALTPLAAAPQPQPKPKAEPQPELFSAGEGLETGVSPIIGREVAPEEAPLFSKTAQEEEPEQSLMPFNEPLAPAEAKKGIDDAGEKIGGARKDLAIKTGPKAPKSESQDPGWRKRFEVSQIVKSQRPGEEGQWVVTDTRKKDWKGQGRKVGGLYATKEEAEATIPLAAVARNHRAVPVGDGKYEIWRDVTDRKRLKVVPETFDSREDAMTYMAQHAEDIIETKTSFGEEILPIPDTVTRKGKEYRSGKDVDAQKVHKDFGLRGVEFGKWENQEERQQVVNHAYDGLMDLADVLNIPPEAIGLDGELSIAFGARGHGLSGARAHYERDYGAMNLTKMKGAGSLAHEWFHAADHYFGRQDTKAKAERVENERGDMVFESRGREKDYASHGFKAAGSQVREEVRQAYTDLIKTMYKKAQGFVEDSAQADKFVGATRENLANSLASIRQELSAQKDTRYYKRHNKPASAEQLAQFDEISRKVIDGEALETDFRTVEPNKQKPGKFSLAGMRWTNDALEQISAIYKAVRGRSGFSAEGRGGVMDGLRSDMKLYSARLKMLADAQSGEEKIKMVPTEFAKAAKSIDQGRASDYWATNHEMAARAFQAYVEDKLAERGEQSDFLTYGTHRQVPTPWGWQRPFPEGEERKAINQAFDKLFEILQTKETDKGVALFEKEQPYGTRIPESEARRATIQPADDAGQRSGVRESLSPDRRPEPRRAISPLREGGGVRTIGKRLTQELARVGKLDLRGATVRNTQELAELAQIYRNPQYETLRVWYVKDGKVVGHEGLTSRLPNVVSFAKNSATIQNYIDRIAKLKKRFKADGYYLQHNHPSGDPTASREDKNMTALLADQVLGMQGHVIINHGKYAVLTAKDAVGLPGTPPGTEILEKMHPIDNKNFRADPHKVHPFLGANATDYQMIAEMGKRLQAPKGYTTVIYRGAQGRVEAIQEVPDNMVRAEDFAGYIRNSTRDFGAVSAFTYSTAEDADLELRTMELVEQGVLRDALTDGGEGLKLATEFVRPATGNKNLSQGISATKAFQRTQKVMEDDAEYTGKADKPSANAFADLERQDKQIERKEVKAGSQPPDGLPPRGIPPTPAFDGFDVPSESTLERIRRYVQDRFRRLAVTQEAIAEQLGPIEESKDAYLHTELFPGKVEPQIVELEREHFRPLIQAMHEAEISKDQLDQFLYAKHAPERNAHVASINDKMPDAGSGMSDAKAQQVLADFNAKGLISKLEALASRVYAINQKRLDTLVNGGLITAGERQVLNDTYEFYVPLKGAPGEQAPSRPRIGKGFDIRGKENKRALGRKSEAHSILEHVWAQSDEAIIRAEKNLVGQAFLEMATQYPHKEMWTVNPVKFRRYFDQRTGEVKAGKDPLMKLADNVMSVKVKGKEHYIEIHDEALAQAMKNLGAERSGMILKALQGVNRYLAMVNTALNPEFVLSNFQRDIQTAGVNLAGEKGLKFVRKVMMGVPGAVRGSYGYIANQDTSTEWGKWFKEYEETGGRIGFFGLEDIEVKRSRLNKLIERLDNSPKAKVMGLASGLHDLIFDLNGAIENGVRLSAYKQARTELGMSPKKAASLARNLTVDFNKKGILGNVLNGMYLFFNANLQGTARLAKALTNKRVQKIVGGAVAGAFLHAELNRWLAGIDPDDDENYFAKLEDYIQESFIPFFYGAEDGSFVKWQLPYGYNTFYWFGQALNRLAYGDITPGEFLGGFARTLLGAFNPLGSDDMLLKNAVPTFARWWVDLELNRNFFGGPIMPEPFPFAAPKPDSEMYFRSVSESSKALAQNINRLTGGSQWRPGWADVSPETIDYMVQYFTGGTGATILRSGSLPVKLIKGTEIESNEVPLVRKFLGNPSLWKASDRWREEADDVATALRQKKDLKETDPAKALDFEVAERPLLRLERHMKVAEKALSYLSDLSEKATTMEDEAEVEAIREASAKVQKWFHRHYRQAKDGEIVPVLPYDKKHNNYKIQGERLAKRMRILSARPAASDATKQQPPQQPIGQQSKAQFNGRQAHEEDPFLAMVGGMS